MNINKFNIQFLGNDCTGRYAIIEKLTTVIQ